MEHSGLLAERSKASGKVYAVDGVPVDYSSALYVVPWVLGPVRALNLRRLFDRYRRAWFTVDHVEALPARNLVRLEVVSYAGGAAGGRRQGLLAEWFTLGA